eukprot:gene5320-5989_t
MATDYYTRRSRYASSSFNEAAGEGYASDGSYRTPYNGRLNKSHSLEDLTGGRSRGRDYTYPTSSRGRSNGNGDGIMQYSGARGTRDRPGGGGGKSFSSTNNVERFTSTRRYVGGSRDRDADISGYRSGMLDGVGRDGDVVGILKNREYDARLYSSSLSKQRDADSSLGSRDDVLGGNANLHQQYEDGSSRVKYRIQGEITRSDSPPDDPMRGYTSDYGTQRDGKGYASDRGYSSETSAGHRRTLQGGRDRLPSLTLPEFSRESGNRRSLSMDTNVSSISASRVGRSVEREVLSGRGSQQRVAGGLMRREPDDNGPYRGRARSTSPKSQSSQPGRRVISPNRNVRRASSMSNLLAIKGQRGGRNPQIDTSNAAGFPVCSRWPNCTVCSIDIPSSHVNKDTIMKTMKAELKEEVENIALLEKKEKTIQEKAESNAYLTQELQRCQKEIDIKSAEINRKDSEINALKIEVKNLEISKRHTEKSYSEIQVEVNRVELAERKITDIQEQHDVVLLKNRELIERIKHLEIAEKEFIELERNVIDLQEQLRGMGDIEAHRDELYGKFQNVRRQRDEFLKKGRMVEEERNDFMRTNQTMEQHLEDYKKKYNNVKKTNGDLNRRVLVLEREKKEVETKILDVQNDRNIMQTALGKLEVERDDLIREVKEVTSERNMLEQKLAEMDEMLSDHDHLEEGFHSLRLKLAELTRQRDDAEMLIPSLKAKIALLKKACREKDETVTRHVQELKHVKYNASSSANQNTKTQRYESNKPNPRTKQKSSFFVETEHETRRHSRPRKIEYELQDGSVQLSEDDRSISEDGSILVDRRDLIDATTRAQNNRSVRVFEQQPRTRSTSSSRSKSYKAVFDYDPYKSSSSIHPERELKLKEGDYITVYGEMDVDGYLEAEVDGQTGLVPSIYVEDVDEESRNISRSNELRNVSVRSSHGQRQRKFATLYDYDPYTMGRNGRAEQELNLRKGDVVTVIGDVDVDGYYTAEINGRRGLIPSNFMRELGTSQSATSSSYGGQKLYETQSTTRTTEQRSTSGNRTGGTMEIIRDDVVGPPFPPSNLKIIRVVNKDSVLLSWKLPQMDKFGRSNGALITGYKIWVNGRTKQEVKSHTMTKAIVSGLNLKDKLDFDIQTVGENGFCSEKCLYTITNAYSLLNPIYEEFFAKAPGNYRTFVALYDYDPFKSSPNPNPSLELGFSEGDLLKVYDTSRSDGFYHAEIRAKKGLVPSNFLEEISVGDSNSMYSRDSYVANSNASEASQSSRSYSHSTQQHQRRASNSEYEKRSSLSSVSGGRKRKMVAVYDYDPLRQSPSKDKSKELNLRKGQYVTVIGDMRPDGFYLGEVDGRQGLVPGDFLEPQKDEDGDSRRVQFVAGDQVK